MHEWVDGAVVRKRPGKMESDRGALALVQHAGVEAAVVRGCGVGTGAVVEPLDRVADMQGYRAGAEAEVGDRHAWVRRATGACRNQALFGTDLGEVALVPSVVVLWAVVPSVVASDAIGTAGPDALAGEFGVRPARVGPAPRRAGG